MSFSRFVLLGALTVFSLSTSAGESRAFDRYEHKGEGWYWKNDPKKEEGQKPSNAPKKPFSVEWLRENLPKLRDRAIDDPTPENIRAYLYAQRVAMDKAQVFAKRARDIAMSDPLLDETQRVPMASFAVASKFRMQKEAKAKLMQELAKKGGIWFFYKSDCAFCEPMAEGVRQFVDKHGFILYAISLDHKPITNIKYWYKDQGQAKKLGIKVVPTVIYVVPPNNYFFIAQGAMAPSELEDRLILAAKVNGLVPKKYLTMLEVDDRGVLGPGALSDGATDDPVELVNNIRQKLLKQYDQDGVPTMPVPPRPLKKPVTETESQNQQHSKGGDQ